VKTRAYYFTTFFEEQVMTVFLTPLLVPRCAAFFLAVLAPAVMATTTTVIQNPGSGTNHIEVSNNTASGVQKKCADSANSKSAQSGNDEVNVNSVHINKEAMVGKTIIITGRNSRDVVADKDCISDKKNESGTVNINSVNIR
jgi:hypothetical protein